MAPAVSELDRDLRAMWKAAASAREGGGGIHRAALSNLVTPLDPEHHRTLAPVLIEVTRRHPSRLIVVEIGPGEDPPGLEGEVAALCHLRAAGGYVCSEQIVLRGGARAGALAPSAVRSLLVGNLPLVLLDLREGAAAPWVEEIGERADLHLADSERISDVIGRRDLWRRIAADGQARRRDLQWSCLTPWREIVADAVDVARLAPALPEVSEVTIEIGRAGPCFPDAPLLAGWIASRLGWSGPVGRGGETRFRSPSGSGTARVAADPDAPGRGVHRVRFRSKDPGRLDLVVARAPDSPTASVEVAAPARATYEVPFHERDFVSMIVAEMHRHEPNPILCESARLAAEISLPEEREGAR